MCNYLRFKKSSCSPPAAEYALAFYASFDSLLSRAGLEYLAKGGLFVLPPLEECLTGITGSSTRAGAGTDNTDLQLIGSSVFDCQALT